ncbi:MAG: polyprenyl synthetase family protein [Candidatus Symbiobacter sp.]|nr:polyprenyl synthetase family protein [Candidatus Symbiobacter sp.]
MGVASTEKKPAPMQMAAATKLAANNDAASLEHLSQLVAHDMAQVNELILARMQSPVTLIPQLAGHLIASGGKRLRPMLTLATAALCGYRGVRHHRLAAAVEFIHTATLLHDDVVDESNLRRGVDSANALFGNKPSVLVGDFLFSRAFSLMVEDGSLRVLEILSDAAAIIAEGEVQQLMTSNDLATTEAAYLNVIRAKTASLFAAAARIGAVVADRPPQEEEALGQFGLNLGLAFQLVDDALDYAAEQEKLGKNVGDDFREGKMTLPVILAVAHGQTHAEERAFWQRTMEHLDQNSADLARAQAIITAHNGIADTLARADEYAAAARASLLQFPPSPIRQALLNAVRFAVTRGY